MYSGFVSVYSTWGWFIYIIPCFDLVSLVQSMLHERELPTMGKPIYHLFQHSLCTYRLMVESKESSLVSDRSTLRRDISSRRGMWIVILFSYLYYRI
jgi:hypothetical protein